MDSPLSCPRRPSPSLSIRETNGKVLLHCFKGRSYRDIITALGVDAIPATNGQRKIVAIYQYENEAGVVLYEMFRFDLKE
jgi:hypothetical protein